MFFLPQRVCEQVPTSTCTRGHGSSKHLALGTKGTHAKINVHQGPALGSPVCYKMTYLSPNTQAASRCLLYPRGKEKTIAVPSQGVDQSPARGKHWGSQVGAHVTVWP